MRCICGGMQSIYSIRVWGSAQQMGRYFSPVGVFQPQMGSENQAKARLLGKLQSTVSSHCADTGEGLIDSTLILQCRCSSECLESGSLANMQLQRPLVAHPGTV